jgi:hypothetical protein
MSTPSSREAAGLIRQVIARDLSERELAAQWPESPGAPVDLANSRQNLDALFVARRTGDAELARLLEEDLADAADALEAGRSLKWFETQPHWSTAANRYAFAVGLVGGIIAMALDWPRWTWSLPLILSLAVAWSAEWVWSRRQLGRWSRAK